MNPDGRDGAELQRCNGAGDGYVRVKTCPSEAMCPVAGDCADATCKVGQKTCIGDVLSECNAEQAAFEDVEACEPDPCDAQAGECDVCVPGSADCMDGGTARICNAEGTTLSPPGAPGCHTRVRKAGHERRLRGRATARRMSAGAAARTVAGGRAAR